MESAQTDALLLGSMVWEERLKPLFFTFSSCRSLAHEGLPKTSTGKHVHRSTKLKGVKLAPIKAFRKESPIAVGRQGMQRKAGSWVISGVWTQQKLHDRCCQDEGTEKHTFFHCKEWKEERSNLPHIVRWCENVRQIIKRRMEMTDGFDVVSNMWQRMDTQ